MTQALASNPTAMKAANAFKGDGVTIEDYIVGCAAHYADALLKKVAND